MSNQPKSNGSGGSLLILLGALVVFMPLFLACHVASKGAKYRTVKLFTWPVAWFFSNFIASGLVFSVGLLVFGMLLDQRDIASYIGAHVMDWNMASAIFNHHVDVPHSQVFIFQFITWLFLVRPMARHLTVSVIDGAICFTSSGDPIVALNKRRQKVIDDPAYEAAIRSYIKKPPILGVFLVMGSPIPVTIYY